MTYFPLAETHDTGEAYFTSLGILGSSTGMAPIISATTTMPTPDAYSSNLTRTITDSVLKYTQSGASNRQFSYDLGGSYSKLLVLSYFQTGTSYDSQLIGASTNTYSGSQATQVYAQDFYVGGVYSSQSRMYKRAGTASPWTALASDTSIYPLVRWVGAASPSAPVYGAAMYLEEDSQKLFLKFGSTSQWFQVIHTTDDTSASFGAVNYQTAMVSTGYYSTDTGRMITPFYVWGAS
tara:strand:- start:10208 stop:10915 length:708 start_codon:yes stop_codon:yes gene_type:complete